MSVTAVSLDDCESMVELAEIACAEIGAQPGYRIGPGRVRPITVINGGPIGDRAAAAKALRLAALKVKGPGFEMKCDAHPRRTQSCGLVTVVDALLGRTCHKSDGAK